MESIIEYIKQLCDRNKKFQVESIDIFEENKLVVTLLYDIDTMLSVEVLFNKEVCDFLIVDFETENILFSSTKNFSSINELQNNIHKFFEEVAG